jgi:hypothetical protein
MVEPETSLMPNGGPDPILAQTSVALQAGEKRRVFGRVEITSTVNSDVYVETYTVCVAPDGTESQRGGAAQNHEGMNTSVRPGYPMQGHLVLYPSLLFTAPMAGTYVCQLRGNSGGDPLTAVARSFQGSDTTWLRVSAANDVGAAWWQGDNCDEWGDTDGTVHAAGSPPSYCMYLQGATHQQQVYVFDNNGSPPQQVWAAANDAAFVDASANLMVTTCYSGTNSCTNGNKSGDDGTVVASHLELIQLNAAGETCNVTQSPDQVSTVGTRAHHYMIYYKLLTVPVYPRCGSGDLTSSRVSKLGVRPPFAPYLFKLRISVKYMSGSPVKIDGYEFTHAFAFTSAYGIAEPVPNVGGLTEAAAGNALTAAGYAVSIVSNRFSTAPQGMVISQYPSAGIIEFPGSGVNLTLSTGSLTVPNLDSLPQTTATDDLSALGLVSHVSLSKVCTDPGKVVMQARPPDRALRRAPLSSSLSIAVRVKRASSSSSARLDRRGGHESSIGTCSQAQLARGSAKDRNCPLASTMHSTMANK